MRLLLRPIGYLFKRTCVVCGRSYETKYRKNGPLCVVCFYYARDRQPARFAHVGRTEAA